MQIFVIIWFVLFFWIIGKGIAQFIENENSPVLTGPASINYGNTVIGNDAANYWNGSTLKISALEQVDLLVKLYNNAWGFDNENVAAVKNSMLMSASGDTALYGKTGTGRIDSSNIAGWFVGYVEQAGNTYFFAVYLCSDTGADGATAIQIAIDILDSTGIKVNIPA